MNDPRRVNNNIDLDDKELLALIDDLYTMTKDKTIVWEEMATKGGFISFRDVEVEDLQDTLEIHDEVKIHRYDYKVYDFSDASVYNLQAFKADYGIEYSVHCDGVVIKMRRTNRNRAKSQSTPNLDSTVEAKVDALFTLIRQPARRG
jgi:hypothetical protein